MDARSAGLSAVPYFCQWESAHLADAIIRKELALADDPAWPASGARDVEEYVRWANHVSVSYTHLTLPTILLV